MEPTSGDSGITIEAVDVARAAALTHLTFPARRHILEEPGNRNLVLFAARSDEETVGLVFFWIADHGEVELISLYVEPFHRSGDLPLRLLRAGEQACLSRGAKSLSHMTTIWEDDDALARLLLRDGWLRPHVRQMVCNVTVERALTVPWLMNADMPDGYDIIDWTDVTPDMRDELQRRRDEDRTFWPGKLDPFDNETGIYEPTSIALVCDNRVRGWLLCHALGDDAVRWTISWVDESIQSAGRIVPLWRAGVLRQAERTDRPRFLWAVPAELPRMCRFVSRRMHPWLTRLGYAVTMTKQFDDERG
ncbi:MAG: GNAT family N-acetyltransferase [Alphaproteobacteria bacterium]